MAARYVNRVVLPKSGVVLGAGSIDNVLTESAVYSVFGVHAERAYTTGGEATLLFYRVEARSHESGRGEIVPHAIVRDNAR